MWRGMIFGALLAPGAALAQEAPEQAPPVLNVMITQERHHFLPAPPPPPNRCKDQGDGGDIVVCGRTTQTERYRVPSSADDDPLSGQATRNGVPHTGQSLVTSMPDCSPGHGCHAVGRAPPPIYYIDVTALPAPPPGSDADKIAKGEMRAP